MPEGKHYRRGHWVKNPTPRAKSSGTWIGAAAAAVLGWGLLNGCINGGTADNAPAPKPSTTTSSTSR